MACEFICDGCARRAPAEVIDGRFFKPFQWFQRSDDDGTQVACSRECVEAIAQHTGKTSVVLPI